MVGNGLQPVNLFVVGAMKSGSTTLHEYLGLHPEIFMSEEKEPGFFVPELWRGRPESEYQALFSGWKGERYIGESSTHYTKLPTYPGVVDRLHAYNPDARILYVMRHPIERVISHYLHAVRDVDFYGETRDIGSAIAKDPMYIAYSDYSAQISPYLERFGRDKVLTLTFETLVSDPQATMDKVFAWLGLPAGASIERPVTANQAPSRYRRARGGGVLNRFRHSSLWGAVSPMVPKGVRQLGVALAEEETSGGLDEESRRAVYETLAPVFADKVKDLERLTGDTYGHWGLE